MVYDPEAPVNDHADALRTAPEGEGQPVVAAPAPAALLPTHVGRYRFVMDKAALVEVEELDV